MDDIRVVCVIGLGQIGGSLAWGLKLNQKHKLKVIGISRREDTIKYAVENGIIDDGGTDLRLAHQADISFICVHLGLYEDVMKKIKGFDGILSDVGSTKRTFERLCRKHRFRFCGSHPIAGTEKSGVEHASPSLFKDKVCVISGWSDQVSKNTVSYVWELVGAKIVKVHPKEHDKILAYVSHLPHIIAFATLRCVNNNAGKVQKFFGGSFQDITRVAKSPAQMWADILIDNGDFSYKSASEFLAEIKKILRLIKAKDRNKLLKYIERAKKVIKDD